MGESKTVEFLSVRGMFSGESKTVDFHLCGVCLWVSLRHPRVPVCVGYVYQ